MSKNIYATTLRLNLDNPADRAAWEHLQRLLNEATKPLYIS